MHSKRSRQRVSLSVIQGIRIDISVALFGNCHIVLTGCKIQEKIKSIVEELTDELILSIDVAVTQIIK